MEKANYSTGTEMNGYGGYQRGFTPFDNLNEAQYYALQHNRNHRNMTQVYSSNDNRSNMTVQIRMFANEPFGGDQDQSSKKTGPEYQTTAQKINNFNKEVIRKYDAPPPKTADQPRKVINVFNEDFDPHDAPVEKNKDYLKNEMIFFDIQDQVRAHGGNPSHGQDTKPSSFPQSMEITKRVDRNQPNTVSQTHHIENVMRSQNMNLSEHHTAKFDENQDFDHIGDTKSRKSGPANMSIRQGHGGKSTDKVSSHAMSQVESQMMDDQSGGFPRSKIRSQDQNRVAKFLKKQQVIKTDDPILKFTNYQSYRQLKSGQGTRQQKSIKSN